MEAVFTAALLLLGYIFVGYPLLLWVLRRLFNNPIRKGAYEPHISLIISAYNEENVIAQKIENTLEINYPSEKLEIIVCSDGSTDTTDEVVKRYGNRVRLLRIEGRVGKPECQNQGAAAALGEVLVFSDANSMYEKDALKLLMENLSDPRVGVVCGELRYKRNDKSDEGLYWKLEKFLKESESALGSCLGANGAIYAVRKHLYRNVPAEACSDFIEPFFAYKEGYRVVYEPRAFCTEVPDDNAQEFARKQRIVANSLQSLYLIKEFLNPLRHGWYSLALWSHKMLRWYAFAFLIVAFVANAFLIKDPLFLAIFLLQCALYVLAALGIFLSAKPFSIPYYFVLVNLASLLAFLDTLRGGRVTSWEKVR